MSSLLSPPGLLRAPWFRRPPDRRRSRGQSVVEFALVLPVFLLLLLMAVDFGRVFFTDVQLNNAVREAANYGATNPLDTTGMLAAANTERNAQSQGGQQDVLTDPENIQTSCATPADVAIPCGDAPGGGGAGNTLTVTLTVPFTFFTPLIGGVFNNDLHISAASTVAVLNSAADPNDPNPSGCNGPTTASLTVSATDLTVTLDPSGSTPDSGLCAISGYNYDFGDGETGVGGTVPTDHTYASAGTYTITLEVTNQGGSLTTSQTVTLPPEPDPSAEPSPSESIAPSTGPCAPPVAAFSSTGPYGSPSVTFDFTDKSTYDAGCPITNWRWDFGDGLPLSNAPNPTHTFPKNNKTYSVTLEVTNSGGTTSATHQVHT